MKIIKSFKKFLTKHSDELGDLLEILAIVIPALNIDKQDKQKALNKLEKLRKVPENIAKSVKEMDEEKEASPIDLEKVATSVIKRNLPTLLKKIF